MQGRTRAGTGPVCVQHPFPTWPAPTHTRPPQLAVFERWHTRTAAERWQLVRLSVAYLGNAFVVPLLASHFAGSASSW